MYEIKLSSNININLSILSLIEDETPNKTWIGQALWLWNKLKSVLIAILIIVHL